MNDEELLYPGAMLRLIYLFLGDPQNRYGGNLIGQYTQSETVRFPALAIENRPSNILSVTGVEIIIETIPRHIVVESSNENGLQLSVKWGLYVVNKTGSDENLVRCLIRLIKCLGAGESHLLNTEDKVSNGSQFFFEFDSILNIPPNLSDFDGICTFTLPNNPSLPDLKDPSYYENLDFDA